MFMAMLPVDLPLPVGTVVLLFPDMAVLELQWQGIAGRHVVRLNQALPAEDASERAEAFLQAIELFRNVVGLEVVEDALHASGILPAPPASPDEKADAARWHHDEGDEEHRID